MELTQSVLRIGDACHCTVYRCPGGHLVDHQVTQLLVGRVYKFVCTADTLTRRILCKERWRQERAISSQVAQQSCQFLRHGRLAFCTQELLSCVQVIIRKLLCYFVRHVGSFLQLPLLETHTISVALDHLEIEKRNDWKQRRGTGPVVLLFVHPQVQADAFSSAVAQEVIQGVCGTVRDNYNLEDNCQPVHRHLVRLRLQHNAEVQEDDDGPIKWDFRAHDGHTNPTHDIHGEKRNLRSCFQSVLIQVKQSRCGSQTEPATNCCQDRAHHARLGDRIQQPLL
mmetsp:Transcript_50798/g.135527  ORF Transcript_50798/g.135527 Transcript_50798/m.135527 type:complete len:282 (+) Transcript_50798:1559-2404(+)